MHWAYGDSEEDVGVARSSQREGVLRGRRGLRKRCGMPIGLLVLGVVPALAVGCRGGSVEIEPSEVTTPTVADAAPNPTSNTPSASTGESSGESSGHTATLESGLSSAFLGASSVALGSSGETSRRENSAATLDASTGARSNTVTSDTLGSTFWTGIGLDAGASDSTWLSVTASESMSMSDAGEDAGTSAEGRTLGDAGPEPWDGGPIVARSGFVEIEPISYVRNNASRTSSSARLFYSFRPADADPHLAPTFVFFNGGPGYGTSIGLMTRGTGPMTVGSAADSTALVVNPWSWTQLGNLLYIDTRQAGFSYSTIADPSDATARSAENDDINFNDYLDPADLLRAMLRVLASTPGIQDNPVVLVGESYGGVRATMMLAYLLDHERLRTASWYADPALADEIAAHYAAVGQNYADPRDQFPAQVLIQPFIAGTQFEDQAAIQCLPGSKEQLVAEEHNLSCADVYHLRDAYNIVEEYDWSTWLDVVATEHLTSIPSLQSLLGVEPTTIIGLGATDRTGAFRITRDPVAAPQPGFEAALGALQPWDAYHVASNGANYNDDVYDNPYPCVYFSRVIARVATFVTDADADMVVDTPAMPTTMMRCQQLVASPFIDDIQATHESEGDEPRPGRWTITFNANSPEGAGERKVRWPTYAAGHMVAVSQPQQLLEDVRDFLRENAVIP